LAYLDRVLQPGETILVRARLHWVIYLPALAAIVLAAGVAIGTAVAITDHSMALAGYALAGLILIYGVITLLGRLILVSSTEFGVTDHRVIVKRGLVSLHTVEMNVDKVESVDVDQTILGRMLGYGSVTVHGVGARWDPITRIADPLGFRSAITAHTPAAKT
jgi:uncharacterized membrane protein YdbT with pleckstrin-like domain